MAPIWTRSAVAAVRTEVCGTAPTNGSISGPLISFWKKWLYANEILKFLVKLYEAPSAIFA